MGAWRRAIVGALVVAATAIGAACADDGPLVGAPGATNPDGTAPTPDPGTAPGGPPTTTSATAPSSSSPPPPSSSPEPTSSAAPATSAAVTPTTAAPDAGAPTDPRPALTNADGEDQAFNGIGQLDGFGSRCTAFLVDAGEPSGPAYAMTNGHCVGLFDATSVVRDQPGDGATVRFGRFADAPTGGAEVAVETVLYATMRGTDVAVLELAATRSDVIGLSSYALGAPPTDGAAIRVVGVPADGVAEDEQVLRGATCTAGATTRLVEFEWLWDAAVASDCLGIVGGSSGSPVFAASGARRAVGIVNTTTIGAPPGVTCSLGQPCELGADGATTATGRTYLMPVGAWDACFTPEWDPTAVGCPVEAAPVAVDAPLRAVRPGARWAATLSGGSGGPLVVKAGPAATTDCRDRSAYAAAPPDGRFDELLPLEGGLYVLCAAATGPSGAPDVTTAGAAVMVVDATPPDVPIRLSQIAGEDGVLVEPIFAPPELSSFDLKVGPSGATDCADPAGYSTYRRVPVAVAGAELPATGCVVGEDEAGNKGSPQSFELT